MAASLCLDGILKTLRENREQTLVYHIETHRQGLCHHKILELYLVKIVFHEITIPQKSQGDLL